MMNDSAILRAEVLRIYKFPPMNHSCSQIHWTQLQDKEGEKRRKQRFIAWVVKEEINPGPWTKDLEVTYLFDGCPHFIDNQGHWLLRHADDLRLNQSWLTQTLEVKAIMKVIYTEVPKAWM